MDPRIKRLYWQITALLLAAHFAGWKWGMPCAIAINLLQFAHFAWWRKSLSAFDVQVRAGYLGLLLIGHVPYLFPIHVIQFVGVNAMLVADYCLLARLLTLLPWNRGEPISGALLRWVFFSPPAPGAINLRTPAFR